MWQELSSPGNRGAELTLILLQHLTPKIFHHSAQWVLSYQEDGQCHYRVWYLSKGVTAGPPLAIMDHVSCCQESKDSSWWCIWITSPVVHAYAPSLTTDDPALREPHRRRNTSFLLSAVCPSPRKVSCQFALCICIQKSCRKKKIRQTLVLRLPAKKATEFWLYGCGRGTTDLLLEIFVWRGKLGSRRPWGLD